MTRALRVVATACALAVAACGDGKPTARVRDARMTTDGSAVLVALERGTERIEGNLFSGHSVRSIDRVELHRLDLTTGAMSLLKTQALAADATRVSVSDFAADARATPLPDCQDLHSECVARTVPAPFTLTQPDLFDKSVVAPVAGMRIAWTGAAFASTPFTARTADEARAEADAAMRRTVALIDRTAHAELAALQARDAPELREPGGDRGIADVATWNEGTRVTYRFVPVATVLASVSSQSVGTGRIAWLPNSPCATDSRLVARAVPDCRYVEERELDATIAALSRPR